MSSKLEKPTYSYIFSILNEIEDTIPVSDWVVNNIHVWPFIRRKIFIKLYGSENSSKKQFLKILLNKVKSFFTLINPIFWSKILKRYNVILCSDGVSKITIDKQDFDMFCSPIENKLKEKNLTFLTVSPTKSIFKPPNKSISLECFDFIAALISFYKTLFYKDINLNGFELFIKILSKHNINNFALTKKKIYSISLKMHVLSRILLQLFKVNNPSLAFIVSYYSYFGYAFNVACKKFKIASIDIQHGTQNGICDAYNQWKNLPKNGYPELPSIFWNWRKEDSDYIDVWANQTNGNHKTFLGGHPWINFWIADNVTTINYDQTIKKIKNLILKKINAIDILITLQVGPVDHTVYWENLAKIINSTTNKDFRWWIRKHPGSKLYANKEQQLINQIKNPSCNILDASSLPLYALLRNVDLHITVESNTAIEAWFFGVRTIFLSTYANESFVTLIKDKYGLVIEKPEEIIQYICNFKHKVSERRYFGNSLDELINSFEIG